MSQQVKKNHENILPVGEIIDNVLRHKGIDINELAMKSGIIPNSLKVAIARGVLSDDNITKIHHAWAVRKEYLKGRGGSIDDENITPVVKSERATDADSLIKTLEAVTMSLSKQNEGLIEVIKNLTSSNHGKVAVSNDGKQ